jgi:two-component system CheB/CheR fusion protein
MDRRKDEFLAALSHELRNPLAAIRTSLPVLAQTAATDRRAEKARAIIGRQAALLTRLVDDLLDETRIARGRIELRREVFDLDPVVRRCVEDHLLAFESSGLRLETRIDGGPFWVDADAARLAQAMGNLLGNAEKFTPRGGTVAVDVRRTGPSELTVLVSDTGAGIAPEMLPHVFDPFVQGPQTLARSRGGLGLGLAVVKGLAELHGGKVLVSSEGPGRGTEVALCLPIVAAPAEVASAAPTAAPRPCHRILVIDDNADNADALQAGLELSGHEVAVANAGEAALELARRFHPDVVVSDIGLPDMDGYDVARAFRADEELCMTFLIAVSGYARNEDLERGAEAGFDRYLVKPVALETLDSLIGQAPFPPSPRPPPRRTTPLPPGLH